MARKAIRINSTTMFHVPNFLRWLRNMALTDFEGAMRTFAAAFPLVPSAVAFSYLKGTLDVEYDEDAAIFIYDEATIGSKVNESPEVERARDRKSAIDTLIFD